MMRVDPHRIGYGSYANVYVADGKNVLKIFERPFGHPKEDSIIEAAMLSRVNKQSPFIVELHGTYMVHVHHANRICQQHPQRRQFYCKPALLLEHVHGSTLKSYIADWECPLGYIVDWMYQILCALKTCHANGIVHGDVHNANVCVSVDAKNGESKQSAREPPRLKLIDFNQADEIGVQPDGLRTAVWYRPPERLVNKFLACHPSMDIWSAGCMFAGLLLDGEHVFNPGKSKRQKKYNNQSEFIPTFIHILDRLVPPGSSSPTFRCNLRKKEECELAKQFERLRARRERQAQRLQLPLTLFDQLAEMKRYQTTISDRRLFHAALHLIRQCLDLDAQRRPSAADALQHACFDTVRERYTTGSAESPNTEQREQKEQKDKVAHETFFAQSLIIDWTCSGKKCKKHGQINAQRCPTAPWPHTC
jgi:serine/threonine protein kinase